MNVSDALPDLGHFTGSEQWFRHSLNRKVTYTQGVQYAAEKAGAYWLVDKIAAMQLEPKISQEPFQVWKLDTNTKTITVEDGNNGVIYTEVLDFTDFPEPGITLWFTDNVILLPSEY